MPMNVIPQHDGSLLVKNPQNYCLYDMGNPHLFVRFDGEGNLVHAFFAEGFYGGAWSFRLIVDGRPFQFREGHGIGRLWKLWGEEEGLEVRLDSFIGDSSPFVFQNLVLSSRSHQKLVKIRIVIRFSLPVLWHQRAQSALVRWIPAILRQPHWWSEGWAKLLLPPAPRHVTLHPGGAVQAKGIRPLQWVTDVPPHAMSVRGKEANIEWQFRLSPGETRRLRWALAAGLGEDPITRVEKAYDEAIRYAAWLSQGYPGGDPLLKSLFVAGLNTAMAMFKIFPEGFAGLVAGPDYAYPPRLYFRDGYWTAQILLAFRPDLVRQHLLSIARGVHESGECPSGVFAPHLLKFKEAMFGGLPDWLPKHLDAPAFFVLLVRDYLRATEDWEVLKEPISSLHDGVERSLWTIIWSAVRYLIAQDSDEDGLIEKPNAPNDWADNVRRGIWVTYDQALYIAALRAASEIAQARGEVVIASALKTKAAAAHRALKSVLWNSSSGYYVNYRRPGYLEDHFSIDTLIVLLYGLAEEEDARRVLDAARRLQTRYNPDQPYGDWGTMCVYPLYRNQKDIFGKSAHPYCYHNGADWPYWDGIYGWLLLQREDPDWEYVLTRWWTYSLDKGWLTPVEYYSPPYPRGGLLQGWSSMPATALIWAKHLTPRISFSHF